MNIQNLINSLNLNLEDILNIYQYGSRVYNCNSLNADYDFIIVIKNNVALNKEIKTPDIDVTFYYQEDFIKGIEEHEISLLECLFLSKDKIWKEDLKIDFKLNLHKLRESISQKSSNSFVKCKKKLIVQEDYDPYIGKKSLFHSLRIIMFGIQLAKFHKITNYTEANMIWNDLMNDESINWDHYKEIYQPIYNHLKTEFRKLCPKTQDNN